MRSASLWMFLVGLGFFILADLISVVLSRVLPISGRKRGIWAFAATYSNNAFMGFPVVYALFGQDGLFLAAILNAAVALLMYTVGVLALVSRRGEKMKLPLRQTLFSNINIALLLGLFFFLTQLQLPDFLYDCIYSFGNITTPLSMIIVGLNMAKGSLTQAFKDKAALSVSAVRLIAMPLLAMAFASLFVSDAYLIAYQVLTLTISMPVAVIVVVLTERYSGQVDFATNTVVVSTCLSLFTIPLMMWLLPTAVAMVI